MKKIFTKEEAQKLEFADAVHLWVYLDEINNDRNDEHWNCFIWKIYKTRLDVHGLSKKNWGLNWDTYGTKWILSTSNNSYDKKNNITIENVKCYLETGSMKPVYKVKCRDCGKEIPEEDAECVTFEDGKCDYLCSDCYDNYSYCEVCDTHYHHDSEVEVYGMRGGSVCSECYDEHGWRYE